MPSLSVAKAGNAAFTPSYVPIMVITGATSGIGQAITQLFANNQHGRAHIVLVGRNRAAAESIIASLPTTSPAQDTPEQDQLPTTETTEHQPSYEFIYCDMSLMKNVHDLARDLSTRLPHINFLVHSAGVFGLGGRQETPEGIDLKLASRYYARWALTNDLLPLLRKAKDEGQPASVLSILGAGEGPEKVDLGDLGLKKNYSGAKAMMQSVAYNDLILGARQTRDIDCVYTHVSRFRRHWDVLLLQPYPQVHYLPLPADPPPHVDDSARLRPVCSPCIARR